MQGELFQVSGTGVQVPTLTAPPKGWMDRFRVTLRLDHLSIVGILALVLYVLVFSFGVEKGKRFALDELRAEKAREQEVGQVTTQPEVGQPITTPLPTENKPLSTQSEQSTATGTLVAKLTESPASSGLPTGKYTIQLITFKTRVRAEREVEKLHQRGFHGFIIPAGKFFQVCADAFETQAEARLRLTHLKAEGLASTDAFIRPNKGAAVI